MQMAVDGVLLVGIGVGVVCNRWRRRCFSLEGWVDLQADLEMSVNRRLVQVCVANSRTLRVGWRANGGEGIGSCSGWNTSDGIERGVLWTWNC